MLILFVSYIDQFETFLHQMSLKCMPNTQYIYVYSSYDLVWPNDDVTCDSCQNWLMTNDTNANHFSNVSYIIHHTY